MNWVLVVFAVIVIALAVGCVWWRRSIGKEIELMSTTATSKAAEVARVAPGSIVEVKGSLRCTAPLTAEFSNQACVYHKSEINREVVYYARGSDGKRERRTRSEKVHSNIRFAACAVQDDSGSVALRFEGADVEGTEVVNRREHENRGVADALLGIATGSNESSSLVHTETILLPDIPIYVLGEVQADRSIGKPAEGSKNRIFVVSQKSEEQRTKALRHTMIWLLVGAIILAIVGAVLGYFAIPH